MDDIRYTHIGIIHSPYKEIEGMPIQPCAATGVKGTVKLKHEYAGRLKDIDGFAHVSMGTPVIAIVHGYAVANGAGLMAAADFAIVAEGTQIGTTAINVGLLCTVPIIPMSYCLGKKKTLEMLLSEDMIDAKEAERLGLVNKVVPADKLEEETFAFAQKLISKSPVAIQMGKNFYYQMIDMPFRQRFVLNSEVMARLSTTEDALEGINAFFGSDNPYGKGSSRCRSIPHLHA
jgi:enoyl-CoA hydratase/carnithine racemase